MSSLLKANLVKSSKSNPLKETMNIKLLLMLFMAAISFVATALFLIQEVKKEVDILTILFKNAKNSLI